MSGGWSIPLDQLAAKVQLDLETVARKSTLDVFTAVVKGAPVDTGRLRANMNVSYGGPDISVTNSTDASRGLKEAQKALTLPVGGVTYITNALPYAAVVEYGLYPNPPKNPTGKTANGYSIQAPQGMFRIAALRYSEYVKKALNQ
jgi:hypothetical protein